MHKNEKEHVPEFLQNYKYNPLKCFSEGDAAS